LSIFIQADITIRDSDAELESFKRGSDDDLIYFHLLIGTDLYLKGRRSLMWGGLSLHLQQAELVQYARFPSLPGLMKLLQCS
jgi:hypothetical protein